MYNLATLFSDYTFRTVALGTGITGFLCGVLGSFCILRKQSLIGDGISHACLPGVVLMFMLSGNKNTSALLLGAFISGFASIKMIDLITKNTRLKFDSALSSLMSVFFGFGIVLLTYVQKNPQASQAGLKNFIFGQSSALMAEDIKTMVILSIVSLSIVTLFRKEIKLFLFDSEFCFCSGFNTSFMSTLLSVLTVMTITAGLQSVGVILISALLITPAASARQWSDKMGTMILLSALFGSFSGIAGTTVSSLVPKLPTGPCIVICISTIALISFLFAPKRGILPKLILRAQLINKIKGGDSFVS